VRFVAAVSAAFAFVKRTTQLDATGVIDIERGDAAPPEPVAVAPDELSGVLFWLTPVYDVQKTPCVAFVVLDHEIVAFAVVFGFDRPHTDNISTPLDTLGFSLIFVIATPS
jgi:hypothetical protein